MKTLFLYIDILGFTEMIKDASAVKKVFRILNAASLHRDSNFQSIVFSDTVVAYHRNPNLSPESKANELMFLIELTQDLQLRLIGKGVFFRAIITEGEFYHEKMTNMDAFYGQALVTTYHAEKRIVGHGLYLDVNLRSFNHVFCARPFSSDYDFVYLTQHCTIEFRAPGKWTFPIPANFFTSRGLEYLIYPEWLHFAEVYRCMDNHQDPGVRAKHLVVWRMYELQYPSLIRHLVANNMNHRTISDLDWDKVEKHFRDYYN